MTWVWKVPSPLPSSTDTVLSLDVGDGQVGAAVAGEVARHDGVGVRPHGVGRPGSGTCRRRCPAAPTRSCLLLATARSRRPSPLKSPATTAIGLGPDGVGDLGPEGAVAVAQEHRDACPLPPVGDGEVGWPSPVKSPATMASGSDPTE